MNETATIQFFMAETPADYDVARQLFREYAVHIKIDLCFQGFEKELEEIAVQYAPPSGGIILCRVGNDIAGCAGIRRITENMAELKRMFIRPAWHGKGFGRQLLDRSLQLAKQLHYPAIRLDTLPSMKSALGLYRAAGFEEIAPYYHNPNAGVIFMEKKL